MEKPKKLRAALLSSPGMGHLVPVIELGNRLVADHGFEVTIFILPLQASLAEVEIIESAMTPKLLDIVELPPPDLSAAGLGPDAAMVTRLAVMMRESRQAFRSALAAMEAWPDVLIVDLFGTEHLCIGDELGIPRYAYVATNAWFLALLLHLPTLDKEVKGEYVDRTEPLEIPGCKLVRPEDVVDPMLDRSDQQYSEFVRLAGEIPMGDGILLNVWEDLQAETFAALRNEELLGRVANSSVYTVGPLIRPVRPAVLGKELLEWLDKQPSDSVMFVSFGSGGTLSAEQLVELAWGLELSQQRFIWVLRQPTVKSLDGSYFDVGKGGVGDGVLSFLPSGFTARTRDIGFILPSWGPQVEILSHPSVGGFLSHCGWNSTLESIANGVPMIAWPLYAEQRLNATLLTEEIGVAVRPKVLPSKKIVGREEIKKLVRTVMVEKEGHTLRARVRELKSSAQKAVAEGGSSYGSLSKMKEDCKMMIRQIKQAH
ncbi:anthocyanidin 3-O-glucosyltransferase 5-like [Syzygium oleosum]|uniref:anthocyanidin 3-O-glucosyltransferase 5-like n=1 Tax=Syzygium oleosum TaxID=219896 RepID=UPI0024BA2F60|nr:anthocyanidin 3-O-glucosyltransferase 5-like [Syzygium oleosum]